ncbi:hypothetical protein C900_02652 [Fulvivirga imtechensis AK7]|uniref:DUF4126 domain-containing protein n=1 Tax=Fulvivirga imtechensis AK7 TaxID=1237149 RepID=L8K290_9BACT|nr:DUF4126 family protein [Fulvivirga imtechensis]ELR73567.1 hypothetical protein C900_02652 [Fulvivirga imtechensis AK7]
MNISRKQAMKVAVGMGAIAGMRSMVAPAILSHYLAGRPENGLLHSKLSFLRSTIFSRGVKLLAAGEVVGDKTPQAPNRIHPVSLLGRAASGGLIGAAAFVYNKEKAWHGVVAGAAAAIASAFLSFYLRKQIGKDLNLNDKIVGAVEDIAVITGGKAIMSNGRL